MENKEIKWENARICELSMLSSDFEIEVDGDRKVVVVKRYKR